MQYLDVISKMTEWSLFISKANHWISRIQANAPTSNAEEVEVEWFYEDLQDLLERISKKDVLFTIGDWNAKERIQEILGPGSLPGSGRSLGEENGYPLQYSCLENHTDRGAWGATESRTRLQPITWHFSNCWCLSYSSYLTSKDLLLLLYFYDCFMTQGLLSKWLLLGSAFQCWGYPPHPGLAESRLKHFGIL